VAFVTALLVAPFAIYVGLDESNQAEVGDCMAGQSASALRIVECTDPDAQWKGTGASGRQDCSRPHRQRVS